MSVSTEPTTPRLFESGFLELFSKVHFSVPMLIFVPLIGYFLYHTVTDANAGLLSAAISLVAGIALWTITEYLVHRFVFHHEPKSAWAKRVHYIMHGVHHDYPNDPLRLVMPPSVSVPVTIVLYFSFGLVFPNHILHPMGIGFAASYLAYDLSHYAFHHARFDNRLWNAMRAHHMQHHFRDSGTKFGVTSALWDRVFGTR